jgi:hypothetical protein
MVDFYKEIASIEEEEEESEQLRFDGLATTNNNVSRRPGISITDLLY